jgi:hypothetical protein
MKLVNRIWFSLGLLAILSALSLDVMADELVTATITYVPMPAPVPTPTLSPTGMVLLSLVLAAVAYFLLRKSKAGRFLASIAAVSVAPIVATAGLTAVRDASAVVSSSVLLTSSTGGIADVYGIGDFQVQNATSVPMLLTAIQGFSSSSYQCSLGTPSSSPQCVPGSTVLQPNGVCYVHVVGCIA